MCDDKQSVERGLGSPLSQCKPLKRSLAVAFGGEPGDGYSRLAGRADGSGSETESLAEGGSLVVGGGASGVGSHGVGGDSVDGGDVRLGPAKKGGRGIRSRDWFGTLNNPTLVELNATKALAHTPTISWGVFGKERSKSGTPHLQFVFHLVSQQTLQWCKNNLPGLSRAHLEVRKGSVAQAETYCRKDGDIHVEFGDRPVEKGQGAAAAMDELVGMVKCGASMESILSKFPAMYFRYSRSIKEALAMYPTPRFPPGSAVSAPRIRWLFGPTGVGKSHRAHEEARSLFKLEDVYEYEGPTNGSHWFDGYTEQKAIIWDDVPQHFSQWLLKFLDKYDFRLQVKGGTVWLKATDIWLTSSFNPADIDIGGQLIRRLSVVEEMKVRYVAPAASVVPRIEPEEIPTEPNQLAGAVLSHSIGQILVDPNNIVGLKYDVRSGTITRK